MKIPRVIVKTIIIKQIFASFNSNPTPIIQDRRRAPIAITAHPRTILPDIDSDQTIIPATINNITIKNIVNKNPLTRIIKLQLNNNLVRGQKVVLLK